MLNATIRPAVPSDAVALAAISIQVWLDTYAQKGIRHEHAQFALETFSSAYFLERIEKPEFSIFVSEQNGHLLGFILTNHNSGYNNENYGYEIEKLYVLRHFQGQGVGSRLLNYASIKLGSCFWLYTWVENQANLFYEKHGLTNVGKFTFTFCEWEIENNVFRSSDTQKRLSDITQR
ncbi:GNAT family N-acetyltransferase [Pseudoalteromonas sp. HM-SA03]|uniref:GNAT family N-acetyltransferase n=1 Tax=Pseudoalteromonas sp. HM-SA03 TaxID=2029678 RepID=UPI000BADE950|nr:GNAT family N-acetyltransferase [Pseudoalteromonas sp. HM-SA03]PAY01797.1 GNAT family N-acetyltransferase [Pseudoalteromonas sp. HM-SA03]